MNIRHHRHYTTVLTDPVTGLIARPESISGPVEVAIGDAHFYQPTGQWSDGVELFSVPSGTLFRVMAMEGDTPFNGNGIDEIDIAVGTARGEASNVWAFGPFNNTHTGYKVQAPAAGEATYPNAGWVEATADVKVFAAYWKAGGSTPNTGTMRFWLITVPAEEIT